MTRLPTPQQRQYWHMCAQLAQAAYEDLDTFRARFPSATVNLIEKKDSQFFTVRWPDQAIIAIRGTQVTKNPSWGDIRRNFQVKQRLVPSGKGRVHWGYWDGWCAVAMPITKFLADCNQAGIPVVVTGHSLGGVTASIVGVEFPRLHCVTFGAPRAGDKQFASHMNRPNFDRLVFATDGASSIPLMSMGYRHGGTRWHISRNGAIYEGGHWKDLLPVGFPYHDHSVDNYVNALAGVDLTAEPPRDSLWEQLT